MAIDPSYIGNLTPIRRLPTLNGTGAGISTFLKIFEPDKEELSDEEVSLLEFQDQEKYKCTNSAEYFINNYCYIFDTSLGGQIAGMKGGRWIPFKLWNEQIEVLNLIIDNQKVVVLKARQNGLTWLCLAYALWQSIFEPIAMILVYSLRDDEAVAMLGDEKMKGMYKRLPEWLRTELIQDAKHLWTFENGSSIRALPTTAGDSYTATMAIVDEADLIPDLNDLLQRVKPTIDAGGKLILISRSNKNKPKSLFKKIYKAAKSKLNDYMDAFLPWYVRPDRTQEWYDREKASTLAETTVLDNLFESYPATDVEALAPSTLDKRLPFQILENHYIEIELIEYLTDINIPSGVATIPGLRLYELPTRGEIYSGGADPAEGNPNSDDSAYTILHKYTGKQVAVFNGKHEPGLMAKYIANLNKFYNNAPVLPERNNHGHALIMALENLGVRILEGPDGKPGYQSNRRTKVELYDTCAESFLTDDALITDFETFNQLSLIEGSTLLAPEGEYEDLADAFALANIGRTLKVVGSVGRSTIALGKSKGWMNAKRRK